MTTADLFEVAKRGSGEEMRAALAAGADFHATDEHGWTPLNWAAGKGHTETIQALLEAGADVTKSGADQRTPYMIAIAAAHVEAARLLKAAEDQLPPEQRKSVSNRRYCKAYYLDDLRGYSRWDQAWEKNGVSLDRPDERPVAFVHEDYTVTSSIWNDRDFLVQNPTADWIAFCQEQLLFKVPDDFDLLEQSPADLDPVLT